MNECEINCDVHIHIYHCLSAPAVHLWVLLHATLQDTGVLIQRSVICFLFHPWLHSCSPHFYPLLFTPDISHILQPFLIYFCHPYPFSCIFHMAQAHCSMPPPFPIGPLFKQPFLPTPLYNTSFFPTQHIFLALSWGQKQQVPPQCWYLYPNLYSKISHKTEIFITATVRTSNVIYLFLQNELYHLAWTTDFNKIPNAHNILFYHPVHIITEWPVILSESDTWWVKKGKTNFQVKEFKFFGSINICTQKTKL